MPRASPLREVQQRVGIQWSEQAPLAVGHFTAKPFFQDPAWGWFPAA